MQDYKKLNNDEGVDIIEESREQQPSSNFKYEN